MSNTNFGSTIPATTYNQQALVGWGIRPDSWEFSASVQHEVVPRVSVDVGYFRRWYGNFTVTDNLAVGADRLQSRSASPRRAMRACRTAAATLITGLYDLNPNKAGQVNNYFTLASDYGKQIEHWNGVDLTVNARPAARHAAAGRSQHRPDDDRQLRRRREDRQPEHAVLPRRDVVPDAGQVPRYLHRAEGRTCRSAARSRAFPGRRSPPPTSRPTRRSRRRSGGISPAMPQNVNVALVEPGTLYGDRLNQFDLRVGEVLRSSARRAPRSISTCSTPSIAAPP